uniref:ATP synthase F0 subunit 8 n=1 Tax=Gregariella coralliophaga TaxID=2590089 RepID=A0A516EZI0_9BIVA|nr:ATP synthase F0 subunit 8 [Gregariella coralliophaga]QDO71903.1 ATP synthase F0 subunit 8 [Gregariella coralliophaga]
MSFMRNEIWWGAVFMMMFFLLELYSLGVWFVRKELFLASINMSDKTTKFSSLFYTNTLTNLKKIGKDDSFQNNL